MHDLDRALAEIDAIRTQMARGTQFRGYGPTTFATTGVLALLAAVGQALWLKDPARAVGAYLALWIAAAVLSVALECDALAARMVESAGADADDVSVGV